LKRSIPSQEKSSSYSKSPTGARGKGFTHEAKPLTVHMLINYNHYASTMLDSGCLTYALVSAQFARKAKLECINLPTPKILQGIEGTGIIKQACCFTYDIEGYTRTGWGYMAENTHLGFDILLGRSWFNKHNVTIAPAKNSIYIHSERTRIHLCSKEGEFPPTPTFHEISAVAMQRYIQKSKKDKPLGYLLLLWPTSRRH
jgi:hypothetical protein